MILMQTPQIVTPVSWLVAPDLLTVDQAQRLSGFTEPQMRFLLDDSAVDLVEIDGETYIDRDSLDTFRDTLLDVLHWRD